MLARYGGALGISAALHAAIALCLAGSRVDLARTRPPDTPIEVVVLPPPAEDTSFSGLKPVERSNPGWQTGDVSDVPLLAGADLARIAGHIAVLFPFVTPGLALDAFFPSAGAPASLVFENPYRRGPANAQPAAGGALKLDDAALAAVVDKAWSRGDRWRAFDVIRGYLERYPADDETLARLAGAYRDRNALQPYADGKIRDLRLWAQLGLAADHVTFIGYIRNYARIHPSSKVTTELLFLLDTLAQANEDALAVLVETDQQGDLEWTRGAHPRAYLLARQIQAQYARELARRGLISRQAIEEFYGRGRLAILAGIAKTTPNGYRANDARFLIGAILWEQGRRDEALRAWRELTGAGPNTHAVAIEQIRLAVAGPEPAARNIDFILRNQQGRWLSFSDERLRRFGYRFDTY